MKDILVLPYGLYMMTLFSLRPPELCFIRSPKKYLSYFVHGGQIKSSVKSISFVEDNLKYDLFNCMWINGANQQVWVQEEAIIEILSNEGCKGNIQKVFINLKRLCDNKSPLFTESNKIYSQEDLDENDLYVIGDISSVEEEEGEVYCGWKTSDYFHILDRFIYKRSKFSNIINSKVQKLWTT